jgi:hypothetical protein
LFYRFPGLFFVTSEGQLSHIFARQNGLIRIYVQNRQAGDRVVKVKSCCLADCAASSTFEQEMRWTQP